MNGKKKNKKFFFGKIDFHSYLSTLKLGLHENNVDSFLLREDGPEKTYLDLSNSNFITKIYFFFKDKFIKSRGFRKFNIFRYIYTISYMLSVCILIIWIILNFKYIFFNSGESFFNSNFDCKIFRFFKIKIITIFVGSESRPPYLSNYNLNNFNLNKLQEKDKTVKNLIRKVEKNFDIIIQNPLSGYYHKKPFVISQYLGNAINNKNIFKRKICMAKKIKVVHFTSAVEYKNFRKIKSSDRIYKFFKRIKSDHIEYNQYSGLKNNEVYKILNESNILIDDLYSDSWGGTISSEAAAHGVIPVIGIVNLKNLRCFPKEIIPPYYLVQSDKFEKELTKLIFNKKLIFDFQKKCLDFSHNYNNPKNLGKRLLKIVNNEIQSSHYCNPLEINWVNNVAGNKKESQDKIKILFKKKIIDLENFSYFKQNLKNNEYIK